MGRSTCSKIHFQIYSPLEAIYPNIGHINYLPARIISLFPTSKRVSISVIPVGGFLVFFYDNLRTKAVYINTELHQFSI